MFWAIRGAGSGNFGVFVELTFKLYKATNITNIYIKWRVPQLYQLIDVYQKYAAFADNMLNCDLLLSPDSGVLEGFCHGDIETTVKLIKPFLKIENKESYELNYADYNKAYSYVKIFNPTINNALDFKGTSVYLFNLLSPQGIKDLIDNLNNAPKTGVFSGIFFSPFGGAVKANQNNNTSFAYCNANYFLSWYSEWDPNTDGSSNISWCVDGRKRFLEFSCGSFFNYVDNTFSNYRKDYFLCNVKKLKEVKQKYNPSNLFSYPQEL